MPEGSPRARGLEAWAHGSPLVVSRLRQQIPPRTLNSLAEAAAPYSLAPAMVMSKGKDLVRVPGEGDFLEALHLGQGDVVQGIDGGIDRDGDVAIGGGVEDSGGVVILAGVDSGANILI